MRAFLLLAKTCTITQPTFIIHRKFPPFSAGARNFPNANSKQFLSRFLSAVPQKYAPKFLRVPYFTTGFTRGYKNHAPSEHSSLPLNRKFPPFRVGAGNFYFITTALSRFPTLTRLIPITLKPVIARSAAQHNPPVIARNAAQRNDEAILSAPPTDNH